MRQLMCHQPLPCARFWRILSRTEHHILPYRKRLRIHRPRHLNRPCIRIYPHLAEVTAEARLEISTLGFRQRLANGELRLRVGGAKDAANLRLLRKLQGPHRVVDIRACLAHHRHRSLSMQRSSSSHSLVLWGHVQSKGRMFEPPSFMHTMNAPRVQRADIPLIKGFEPI